MLEIVGVDGLEEVKGIFVSIGGGVDEEKVEGEIKVLEEGGELRAGAHVLKGVFQEMAKDAGERILKAAGSDPPVEKSFQEGPKNAGRKAERSEHITIFGEGKSRGEIPSRKAFFDFDLKAIMVDECVS